MKLEKWLETLKESNKPTLEESIAHLGDIFPLLHKFKDTPQDPEWHAEGDVHIHTDMVLEELYNIFDSGQFVPTPDQRQILILSAILHDIAKPLVTVERDGHIKSPKHEIVGRDYLIFRLLELNLPDESYQQVINLVGYHQRPKLLVIKNEPDYKYFALTQHFNYELMYWLELADLRGRICTDYDDNIMFLDEYLIKTKQILEQHKEDLKLIPEDKKLFVESYGKYLISHNIVNSYLEVIPKMFAHIQQPYTFTLLAGLPGTGKSTYVEQNVSEDTVIISMDNIRQELGDRRDQSKNKQVASLAKERLKEALRLKKNVLWDATSIRKDHREELFTIATNYGAVTQLIVLLDKESNIRLKNKNRIYDVPDEVITRMKDSFQYPNPLEAYSTKYVIYR